MTTYAPPEASGVSGKIWPDGSFGWSCRRLKPVDKLGLAEATIFRKERAPRGSRGLTGQQRRRIRSGAALLELRYGKRNLSFCTLTLPSLEGEDRALAQQQWAKACDRFFEELSRLFKRKGKTLIYIGCYEIQEERSKREGWSVPHLHFLFLGRIGKAWIVSPAELRELWRRVWAPRFSRQYCWSFSENLQRVQKSVTGYLAKYLSKQGCISISNSEFPEGAWHPSTWTISNYLMKRWIARSSICVSSIWPLVRSPQSLRDLFSRSGMHSLRIHVRGADLVVGVVGWIDFRDWAAFREKFFPESCIPPAGIP